MLDSVSIAPHCPSRPALGMTLLLHASATNICTRSIHRPGSFVSHVRKVRRAPMVHVLSLMHRTLLASVETGPSPSVPGHDHRTMNVLCLKAARRATR